MCEMYSFPVVYSGDETTEDHSAWNSQETLEDRVILETEITLRTGPNITMKIHEESRPNSVISGTFESEEDSRKQGVIKILDDDSESDFYDDGKKSPKTPRKVRFGGESFKLRTPESDSSHQADDENDVSTIKITVTDAISITTRRSLIPVRISSLPSTPKKSLSYPKSSKSHYKSAPNLTNNSSKIPLRKKTAQEIRKEITSQPDSDTKQRTQELEKPPLDKQNLEKELPPINRKPPVTRQGRAKDLSPIPLHKEIELFHNLTRSPERKKKSSPTVVKNDEEDSENLNNNQQALVPLESDNYITNNNINTNVGDLVKYVGQNIHDTNKKEMNEISDEKTYNSFTVYKENSIEKSIMADDANESSVVIEDIVEKDTLRVDGGKKPTLQQSLSSLASEEEIWAKSEALESLVKMLKQAGTCESLEAGPAALLFEALFACHHRDRLHTLADDALTILIEGLRPEVLEQCFPRLALALCKMGASSGVRLALVVMKKLPPKKLQFEILGKGFGHRTREGALQILMACARLYPTSDVEVNKIGEFASSALKDRRRRVRHASLETLAAIAQLSSIPDVLNIVNNTIKDFPDSEEVLQIVRTRLSRKQLPTVDLDGTVRYSSPMDQSETDWISGSILKNNHTSSSSPLSSASSSTPSINYWMHNLRHENNFNNGSTLVQQLPESFEEDTFDDPEKVWITDASALSKNGKATKGPRGVLRPVYILQPEVPSTSTGRGHRKYDRGRSFSPPKHQRTQYRTGLVEGLPFHTGNNNTGDYSHHERNFVHPDVNSRLQYTDGGSFRLNGGFRKSFSSDQLYFGERLPVKHEPYSYSLSSRSSSTSTGSSTKSGFWHKDFRSGIPVPISDGKLKIRHTSSSNLIPSGPMVAKRSAVTSPQRTPISTRISTRDHTILQDNDSVSLLSLPLPPPRSSGSESSGYFTPSPPDTHQPAFIKMDTEERLSSDAEEPEALDSSVNNNSRDCVDSYSVKSTVSDGYLKTLQNEPRISSLSSADTNDGLGEPINDNFPSVESININNNEEITAPKSPATSIVLVSSRPSTVEVHRKSKSVVDLQSFLPEINPKRKGTSSAPPRNDEICLNNNNEHISDEDSSKQAMTPPSVLPLDSMDYSLQHQDEDVLTPTGIPLVKLGRRFCRSHNRKSLKAPKVTEEPVVSRPVSKPKEILQHILNQMDSPVWETTVQGLQGLTKLARQHPEVIENQIHQVCLSLAKQVKNLRSQVSRTACSTAGELFMFCKKGLDMELEEIAAPLFQRTADTNRFLRADANAALDVMCEQLPVNRVILVVTARGCGHQNAVVRATALRLLSDIVKRLGTDRVFQMPKELRDKIFIAGANSLTDGNIDARSNGKAIYRHLMTHHSFQRYLFDAVPQNIIRHISKALASIKSEM